jgi:hypothetical protein
MELSKNVSLKKIKGTAKNPMGRKSEGRGCAK